MHSKATLFTTQFAKVLANLETKVPVMRRKSTGYTFDATAHPDWTGDAFKISDWETWGADECEAAHRLDDSLEDYASAFGAYSTGYDEDDSQYADWAASTGYWPPMLAAVSTAVPEHFTKGAGACVVAHAATVSTYTGFKLPLKYVYNAKAQVRGESSVDDFNRYVANAHESIAGAYPDWAGWDHWLDFHVGLKYGQEHDAAAANATAREANARLSAATCPWASATRRAARSTAMGASQSARCLGALDEPEKKLKAPGQYERLHDDAKRVTAVNTFEGAKFEVAKPLTPTFALNHNFWLGGSYYPNANQHYKFGATVGDNERVCMASLDQYGTLEGQFYGVVAGALQGKFIFNLPKDPKGFVAAVTPRWSLGGEGACALAGPSATASFARHAGKKWTGVAAATRSGSGAIADQLAFSYARVVSPQRVTLGAELVVQAGGEAATPLAPSQALKQSRVNVAVDGNGKMASVVETQLSPAAKLTFSADMQLGYNDAEPGKHRDRKFRYARQIGQ
ncbi:mitochondrial protein translocase [Aureococcus anophagefferens]|uniref:Mitochondrial protein translocase n=1 Tax=Aureococcus anophagefferens TaxID=44056 RepID=A0ABR1FL73_AURAN